MDSGFFSNAIMNMLEGKLLNFIMLVMSLFKQVVINDKKQPLLKTLRYKLFAKATY